MNAVKRPRPPSATTSGIIVATELGQKIARLKSEGFDGNHAIRLAKEEVKIAFLLARGFSQDQTARMISSRVSMRPLMANWSPTVSRSDRATAFAQRCEMITWLLKWGYDREEAGRLAAHSVDNVLVMYDEECATRGEPFRIEAFLPREVEMETHGVPPVAVIKPIAPRSSTISSLVNPNGIREIKVPKAKPQQPLPVPMPVPTLVSGQPDQNAWRTSTQVPAISPVTIIPSTPQVPVGVPAVQTPAEEEDFFDNWNKAWGCDDPVNEDGDDKPANGSNASEEPIEEEDEEIVEDTAPTSWANYTLVLNECDVDPTDPYGVELEPECRVAPIAGPPKNKIDRMLQQIDAKLVSVRVRSDL